jgi:type I restriction enzyme S subunit
LNTTLWVKDFKDNLPRYVYYLLQTLDLKRFNSGAGVPTLNRNHLDSLEVVFHEKQAQQIIASILSAYDDLIENNLRRIRILEEMAQLLYREWFVNFRFPGHEKVRMVTSPFGQVPEGWEIRPLGEFADEVRRGLSPSAIDPDTPYIGLEHMPRKSIALTEWGTAKEVQSTKLAFRRGEVLFGKIRPYFHKVGIAPIDGVSSSDIIVLVAKSEDVLPIVLGCVSSPEFIAHATQTSQGTKMPRANWNILRTYPIAVPSATMLAKLSAVTKSILEYVQILVLAVRNLRQTRDLLLPKLISGQIEVADLDVKVSEDPG